MQPLRAWSEETQNALLAAGWSPERRNPEIVSTWRIKLESPQGFQMTEVAAKVLSEFGKLAASRAGPGRQCARGSFVIDPELCAGEEDRFAAFDSFVSGSLFPLGEADDGHAFLGIDHAGAVYLINDSLTRLGYDIYESLDALLEGRLPVDVAARGRW